MKASLIKKIINKKVTYSVSLSYIPMKNRYSPIFITHALLWGLFLLENKNKSYGKQRQIL
jgi:hypothetical protein